MTATYVQTLIGAFPQIKAIWLIGSRADDSATSASDWDYIAVADEATLNALSQDNEFNNPEIDLLVVYDGNNFQKPWPDGERVKKGSLKSWEWQSISENRATYKATKKDDFWSCKRAYAARVYP